MNLTVTVQQTSEVITVLNRFATTGGTAGVEAIEFSDGAHVDRPPTVAVAI